MRTGHIKLVAIATVGLLLAFALRIFLIDRGGLWGDEAFSWRVARMPLASVVAGGTDTHPPLYHILLHYWIRLAGRSEFSLRFPSLLLGTLFVAAAFRLSLSLFDMPTSVVTLIVALLSPFATFYSQEARMYMLASLLTTLSSSSFIRLLNGVDTRFGFNSQLWQRVGWYCLFTLGAMYTHYYTFFAIAAQNLYILWIWRRKVRMLLFWVSIECTLAVAYLPWVFAQTGYLAGKANARWDAWGPVGMNDVWGNSLRAFGMGVPSLESLQWVVWVLTAIVALGLAMTLLKQTSSQHRAFIGVYLVIPMIIAWAVGPIMPFFYPRFLLVILPAYWLLLSVGVISILKSKIWPVGYTLIATLPIVSAIAIHTYNFDSDYAKSNYKEIVASIREQASEGDALFLFNHEQEALYAYYRIQNMPVVEFPLYGAWDLPANQNLLESVKIQYKRIWVISFGNARGFDTQNNLLNWLNANAFLVEHHDYVDAGLDLYEVGVIRPNRAVLANFDRFIRLTGFGVSSDRVAPGGTIQLVLQWEAIGNIGQDYTIFTHVLDTGNVIWGQVDSQPGNGVRPTSTWKTGDKSEDRFALTLKPDIQPGRYILEVGWYQLATEQRLPVIDIEGNIVGDKVILLEIVVE
jgi:hypothetical protein